MYKKSFWVIIKGDGVEHFGQDDFEMLLSDYCYNCKVIVREITPEDTQKSIKS